MPLRLFSREFSLENMFSDSSLASVEENGSGSLARVLICSTSRLACEDTEDVESILDSFDGVEVRDGWLVLRLAAMLCGRKVIIMRGPTRNIVD